MCHSRAGGEGLSLAGRQAGSGAKHQRQRAGGGGRVAAAPELKVPMKLRISRAGQSGPPDGSHRQLGPPWPPRQVSGEVRAGPGWGRAGAGLDGSRTSAILPLPWLSKSLCASSGAMALRDRGTVAALCRGTLRRYPQFPQPGMWGALGEGGHSMAPRPSIASVVLGVRRACLTVVC